MALPSRNVIMAAPVFVDTSSLLTNGHEETPGFARLTPSTAKGWALVTEATDPAAEQTVARAAIPKLSFKVFKR